MPERGSPVTEVCDHYGISRKTFYKWYGRYRESGRSFNALKDRSRRPHSHPRAVPKRVEERVVAMRRKTRYGPRRLVYYLAQEGITISVYGVYRVLQRAGLWYASDAQGLARSLRATLWLFQASESR